MRQAAELNGYYEGLNNPGSALYVYPGKEKDKKGRTIWFYTFTEGNEYGVAKDLQRPTYGPFETRTSAIRDAIAFGDR